jgi:hypothetical protein
MTQLSVARAASRTTARAPRPRGRTGSGRCLRAVSACAVTHTGVWREERE